MSHVEIPLLRLEGELALAAVDVVDPLDVLLPHAWTSVRLELQGTIDLALYHRLQVRSASGNRLAAVEGFHIASWQAIGALALQALRRALAAAGTPWTGMGLVIDRQLRTAGFASDSPAASDALSRETGDGEWARLLLDGKDGKGEVACHLPGAYARLNLVTGHLLEAGRTAAVALARDAGWLERRLAKATSWAHEDGSARVVVQVDGHAFELPAQAIGVFDPEMTSAFAWASAAPDRPRGDYERVAAFLDSASGAPGMGALVRRTFRCDEAFARLLADVVTHQTGARAVFVGRGPGALCQYFALTDLSPLRRIASQA